MQSENVQVVRRVFDAFTRRDVEAALEIIDPSVEFSAPATASMVEEQMPYGGHAGIRRYFSHVATVWERLEVILHEYHDLSDHVLVVGRVRARSQDGQLVDTPAQWAWRIENGKIVWGRVFTDRAEALKAVGLEEQADPQAGAAPGS